VSGADETLKHRRGKKIAAKGIYRDLAGSSHILRQNQHCSQVGVRDAPRGDPLGFSSGMGPCPS
jgi:hypothetical protein